MQQRGFDAESLPQPRNELRREADLGHQHQHLPARGDGLADQVQVDLGLAAASHAVEDACVKARRRTDLVQCSLLVSVEFRASSGLAAGRRLRVVGAHHEFGDEGLARERPEAAPPCRYLLGKCLDVDAVTACVKQHFEQLGLSRRLFCQGIDIEVPGGVGTGDVAQHRVPRSALAQQCRNRGRGNFADGMVVIVAGKPDEPEVNLSQERGVIEHLEYAANPVPWELAVGGMRNDEADQALLSERHAHARARRRAASVSRREIVEQSRQRHVDGDFEDRWVGHEFPVKTVFKGALRQLI